MTEPTLPVFPTPPAMAAVASSQPSSGTAGLPPLSSVTSASFAGYEVSSPGVVSQVTARLPISIPLRCTADDVGDAAHFILSFWLSDGNVISVWTEIGCDYFDAQPALEYDQSWRVGAGSSKLMPVSPNDSAMVFTISIAGGVATVSARGLDTGVTTAVSTPVSGTGVGADWLVGRAAVMARFSQARGMPPFGPQPILDCTMTAAGHTGGVRDPAWSTSIVHYDDGLVHVDPGPVTAPFQHFTVSPVSDGSQSPGPSS